jgi:hypothetical protein
VKTSIELESGEMVDMSFDYDYQGHEAANGLTEGFTFHLDYLIRPNCDPEDASQVLVTDSLYKQLERAARSTWA